MGKGLKIVELDKTQVTGLIVSIGEQSFTIEQKKGEPSTEIAYAQVRSIHNKGKLSTGAKVGIWVAVGVGIAVVRRGAGSSATISARAFPRQFKSCS